MEKQNWQEYSDIAKLCAQKSTLNETVTVVIPTLNEEKCISTIITTIQRELQQKYPLVDEIVVMDGGSTDTTKELVEACGVVFVDTLEAVSHRYENGKGLALWYAQFVTMGSLICYIDADIENFDIRFVVGLVGPLLASQTKGFTKAYYTRPITIGDATSSTGGGRVTELLIRPLFARFYPQASAFIQPLSGEYAFRRSALQTLRFSTSYAVETILILEYFSHFSEESVVQVDMGERIHRNQPLANLGKMSAAILDHFALLAVEDGLWNHQGNSVYSFVSGGNIAEEAIKQTLLPPYKVAKDMVFSWQ